MTDHPIHHQLSDADAQAVDALIGAGFDVTQVPQDLAERAGRVAGLFGLIDGATQTDPALVDLTMARLLRAPVLDGEAGLCDEDAEALDAYVAAEFRAGKVAQSLRPRAEKIESLVQLISQTNTTEKAGPALVERTMRRVAAARVDDLQPIPIRSAAGFRFADLISVAAVLLMGVAVLWPVLSTVKTYQQKNSCEANLGLLASALGVYTGDNKGVFPMATAGWDTRTWMDVGSTPERSNSSNLYTLAKAGYAKLRQLACSGNGCARFEPKSAEAKDWASLPEVSYSYYIMFGDARPTPTRNPNTIILADKSPVVIRASTGQPIVCPEENSPNHGGRGQWALRANGSAQWLSAPKDHGDNIWLSRKQQETWDPIVAQLPAALKQAPKGTQGFIVTVPRDMMKGNELPEDSDDSFLGP